MDAARSRDVELCGTLEAIATGIDRDVSLDLRRPKSARECNNDIHFLFAHGATVRSREEGQRVPTPVVTVYRHRRHWLRTVTEIDSGQYRR